MTTDSASTARSIDLKVSDLGRVPYAVAFARQKSLHAQVVAARDEAPGAPQVMHLLLLEHDPPVITVSRRNSARVNLIATEQQLVEAGVVVAETDRGGDITYHGPGQLVIYPILDLNTLGLRLHGYMRMLEQVVIEVLDEYGLAGRRDPSATGVWLGGDGPASRKIAAMGVRVSRWVTMHGLAINVSTDLDHFNLIVPCGLADRGVTSMERELGKKCPQLDEVKRSIASVFQKVVTLTGSS